MLITRRRRPQTDIGAGAEKFVFVKDKQTNHGHHCPEYRHRPSPNPDHGCATAQQIRQPAERTPLAQGRADLLQMAERYEQLAARIEKRMAGRWFHLPLSGYQRARRGRGVVAGLMTVPVSRSRAREPFLREGIDRLKPTVCQSLPSAIA